MAAAINRGYVDGKLTAYFAWPLISAVDPAVPSPTAGLILASQPWSGAYDIGKNLWVSAHTAQFAQPGWLYVDAASGSLGSATSPVGSYVTLQSASGKDYATVLETTDAPAPLTVGFTVTGTAANAAVHVWATDLGSSDPARDFVHAADVTPSSGAFWLTLEPNFLYTVTTTTGQGKGSRTPSPARASVGLPITDSFESYAVGSEAHDLVSEEGAFEVVACGSGRAGQCLRQEAPTAPIRPQSNGSTPYAVVGGADWANYQVSADVLIEQQGSVEIVGRYSARDPSQLSHYAGYALAVNDGGGWAILRCDTNGNRSTLQSGNVAQLAVNTWHTITLQLLGSSLIARIDGAQVGSANDSTYGAGQAGVAAGLWSSSWINAQFDNFSVTPLGTTTLTYTVRVTNRGTGLMLDVAGQSTADGAVVQLAPNDEGATSQDWQLVGDGTGKVAIVNVHSGMALSLPGASSDAGAQLVQGTPTGQPTQRWKVQSTGDGFYRLFAGDGSVADVGAGGNAVVTAPLQCAAATQEWSLAAVPVAYSVYKLVNQGTGLLLDIQGQPTNNGGATIAVTDDGTASQRWRIVPLSGGDYNLVNVGSGLLLDVPGGNTTAGTQLDEWNSNGGSNQQWGLVGQYSGAYTIVSTNGKAVDIQGAASDAGGPDSGAPVVENTIAQGAPSQAWRLVPAP
jgi:hypothetical protein